MIRTRVLRSSLAPVLFAAAITGCSSDTPPPPSSETWVAAPVAMADPHSADVPRLLRGGSMPARPAVTATESALAHVAALAPRWGAKQGTADLAPIGAVKVGGGEIVRIRQAFDGIPVERGELRVLVGTGGSLIAASGVLAGAELPRDAAGFTSLQSIDGRTAVAAAVSAVHGVAVPATALSGMSSKPGVSASDAQATTWVSGTAGDVHVSEARARRTWYRGDGKALTAAWVVEAYSGPATSTESNLYRVIVAARGGKVLEQHNLTVDAAFTYKVWAETEGDRRPLDGPTADFSPHPTGNPGGGRPAYIAPSNVTVDGLNDNGAGGFDAWLPADATETSGNNVDAYTDINSPDGLTGADFRASTTSAGVFDRVYDTAASPLVSQSQQMAAITALFYSINWLHDEWYDAGFTEVAGNGQEDNYGRGGEAGDALRAEAQDGANAGRRNNANMSTPQDGMNPRMQVFLWTGASQSTLTVESLNNPQNSTAAYGPGSYNTTGTVIAGVDMAGSAGSTTDGCDGLTNNVTDRIVLVDRGNCTFKTKTLRAQEAGARGIIIANNQGTTPPSLGNDANITTPITIPTMGITMADGATLRTALGNGAVSATMFRVQAVETDGALDGPLVAHEFGHYVHHRLSECSTPQCGAMSEGWGDFLAIHMMARPGDNLMGTYSVSGYAFAGDPYFGIRRAPYSVDLAKNAFTFEMVADDAAIPSSHPISGGGPNSEVHNAGEVWAQALWEVYVALQRMPGADFAQTRAKMARYIVAGLLMSPPDGTFTEIRDSILAAAYAASPADHDVMAAAFARRGLGTCAVAPDRFSADFIGTVEAFEVDGRALPGQPTVALTTDCDADGTMDAGDVATVTLPVSNAGAIALASGASVTVASSTAGLTVPSGASTVGSIAPYGTAAVTFEVSATTALGAGPVAGSFDITVSAEGCITTQTVTVPLRLQADVTPAASATDAFDAPSIWTTSGDGADALWTQTVESGLDRQWSGADAGSTFDVSLESPELIAHATDPVVITFSHSHEFEFSNDTYFDGGVVEISNDGGENWADVSVYADPGYNGTLGGDSGNPLQGRAAYGDINPSFPAADTVTLNLGTQLAGQTFQVRFRIATDAGVGAPGWKIDDFAVTGITNTPFPVQGAETGEACTGPIGPDAGTGPGDGGGEEPGGCCSTGGGARPSDVLGGLLAGAALLLRGRRRRSAAKTS